MVLWKVLQNVSIPWNLPIMFHPDLIAAVPQMQLLSLCKRIVYRHNAMLLNVRVRSGFSPHRWPLCGIWCWSQRTSRLRKRKGRNERKRKWDNTRTNNARSIMWHHGWHVDGTNAHLWPLEPRCECHHMSKVYEKNHVWNVPVYTPNRLQWIVIDCERNQL